MYEYIFTFRSLTPAQTGRNVLSSDGLWVRMERSSKRLSSQGCGYVLRVQANGGYRAMALLREKGVGYVHVYRQFQNGALEEVRP